MLWVKGLHIIFMVAWFAGLFYLPRLFVYHAMSEDSVSRERFNEFPVAVLFAVVILAVVKPF